jgi:hypothetical protein
MSFMGEKYGNLEPLKFIGGFNKEKEPFEWDRITEVWSKEDKTPVIILRSCLWFHSEQKTTLGELRRFFSEKGITSLKSDGFIKIIEDEG